MAMFKQQTSTNAGPWDLEQYGTPPEGTYVATCIDIRDEFGVERPKFNNPTEMEVMDRTMFLFGFTDKDGAKRAITTRWMRISGNEKAALFGFLRSWIGKPYPFGQDYAGTEAEGGMKGRRALITVNHEPRRSGDGTFPVIVSVTPVPEGFAAPKTVAPPAPKPGAKPVADPIPF